MRALLLLPVAALLACSPGKRAAEGPAAPGAPGAPEILPVAGATATDLKQLAWLVGRWRGHDGVGAPFYETYRMESDYLMVGNTWADSTFRVATDTSLIQVQGTEIVTGSNAVATRIDDSSVRFESRRAGANAYTWTRETPDRWTATLTWTGRDSTPQTKTYVMTRLPE